MRGLGGEVLAVYEDDVLTHQNLIDASGREVGRRESGGTLVGYMTDLLGSVRTAVTSTGSSVGAVRAVRDYDPWGVELAGRVVVGSPGTREGYTGHERDAETGMNYAGARFYMPGLGRWTSADPLADRFASLSPYNYALNSPNNFVDPDGASAVPVDDEWTVNKQTGEIERVGSRGGDRTDYYSVGVEGESGFAADRTIVVDRNDGDINMFRIKYGEDFTISTFHSPGSSLSGFMLEPGGPSTTTPNQDRRIPEGTYSVDRYSSGNYPNHFILSNENVSQSRRILIHQGNYPSDTEGCLMPGTSMGDRSVLSSMPKLQEIRNHMRSNPGASLNIFEGSHQKIQTPSPR